MAKGTKTQTVKVVNWVLMISLCAGALSLTGCEPLRKKFTRKKKTVDNQSEAMQPVLDPLEYPDKVTTVEDDYRQFFSLWRVWDKEALMLFEENASDKKINFALNKIQVQMDGMQKLLTGEKREKMGQLLKELNSVEEDMKTPMALRNMFLMHKKIQTIGNNMRKGLRVQDVKNSLVK